MRLAGAYRPAGLVGTGSPKSGKERKVPLTGRLRAALKAVKHLKSELVLCHHDGKPLTQLAIEAPLRLLQTRRASDHRLARAQAHLLLTPRDAGRGAEGDPGAGRPQHAHHDAQVHAPGAERAHGSHRMLDFGQPVGSANDDVQTTDLLQPVGIPPVLATPSEWLRSSGPYVRIRLGLQLAVRRSATLDRRCEPSGVAACRAS